MASIELTKVGAAAAGNADNGAVAPSIPAEKHAASHAHSVTVFKPNTFTILAIAFQVFMIIVYGTCTDFSVGELSPQANNANGQMGVIYSMFQDTHVMMLIGFGFLYALMRKYAWSGIGWTFFITALVLQWGVLLNGFWENVAANAHDESHGFPTISLNLGNFVRGDYAAATVLISFGAIIGRVSATQMLVVLIWEVICSTANEVIGVHELQVSDPGGSMYIHTFGGAFGLALAYVIGDKAERGPVEHRATFTTSRVNANFAMIGTLFLYMFWPSFNGAMLTGGSQQRAAINTLVSISASVIGSYAISKALHHGKRFDMEHIQNATIAGGVAIGAVCNMLVNPWGAMLTGLVAGIAATYGFSYITPALKKLGLTDVCGIFNLHFMSGVIGGIASAIGAAGVELGTETWQYSLANAAREFPGRTDGIVELRSALVQGGYQMAVVAITIGIAVAGGVIAGLLIKLPIFDPKTESFYEDAHEWNVPTAEEDEIRATVETVVRETLAKRNIQRIQVQSSESTTGTEKVIVQQA